MKHRLFFLSFLLFIFSCSSDTDETPENSNTEAFVEKGIKYGTETRQFLDLYKAESQCPTPIYFDAHPNGGDTNLPSSIVEDLNNAGISVIAWESLTSVNTPNEVEMGWRDADLMFQWVIDNADEYNLDIENMIIGGSSRGSILSWKYGHRFNPGIKGLYMYNALPGNVWAFPMWWYPPDDVTELSPPVFFVYRREPGSSMDADDPDIHDPNNGYIIVDTYNELGIRDKASLIHSIGETSNSDRYQFLLDFALGLIDSCE